MNCFSHQDSIGQIMLQSNIYMHCKKFRIFFLYFIQMLSWDRNKVRKEYMKLLGPHMIGVYISMFTSYLILLRYSSFTLRKPHSPLRISGDRCFIRVNRLAHQKWNGYGNVQCMIICHYTFVCLHSVTIQRLTSFTANQPATVTAGDDCKCPTKLPYYRPLLTYGACTTCTYQATNPTVALRLTTIRISDQC